jgi:hypothetical protein
VKCRWWSWGVNVDVRRIKRDMSEIPLRNVQENVQENVQNLNERAAVHFGHILLSMDLKDIFASWTPGGFDLEWFAAIDPGWQAECKI